MRLAGAVPIFLLLPLVGFCAGTATPRFQLEGKPELFRRDHVSTLRTEIRLTVSPDGWRLLRGSIGRPGGPGGWEIIESVLTGWLYFSAHRDEGAGRMDICRIRYRL